MKLRPVLIWMTLLIIGAISVVPSRSSGILGPQGKLTYQPTGSEGRITGKVSFAGQIPQRRLIDTPVTDNQHPWQKAYVSILSHPFFAVSARNGSYQISGLPPGQYTVVAWHERFGEQRAEISVAAGEQKNLDFTFKQPEN